MSKIRVWSAFSRHKHVGPLLKEPMYRHAGWKKIQKKQSIVDDSDLDEIYFTTPLRENLQKKNWDKYCYIECSVEYSAYVHRVK